MSPLFTKVNLHVNVLNTASFVLEKSLLYPLNKS